MLARSALVAIAASTSYAAAGCTTQVGVLALGDLGSCLQLTSLLPVLSASGSIIDSLDTYLKSLCGSSTPTCSNATLTSAQSSISSGCESDISAGGTDAAEVKGLLALIKNYDQVYAAGCSTNSTNGDYCVTDALTTVQDSTGTNVSVSTITSLLSGDSSTLSSLATVLSTGELCTECVSGIYYEVLQANSTIASSTIGQGLTSQCGSSFGAAAPNTTTSASADSSASSAAATSSGASSAGFVSAPYAGLAASAGIAGSVLGAMFLGAAAVL
ncbi:hypothetical protein IAT38_002885 [Cryptococcus sp. DSM 104549]